MIDKIYNIKSVYINIILAILIICMSCYAKIQITNQKVEVDENTNMNEMMDFASESDKPDSGINLEKAE